MSTKMASLGPIKPKSKRKRLELLHQHNPGFKFPMVEDLTDELTDYFDVIGITKVITNIYRYFYDPSNRSDDPVGFLKSLVKARKKDQRELHKAKRKWYHLLWKEWEIKDEIAKLRTLLGVLSPDMFTEEGDPRPLPETIRTSMDSLIKKPDDDWAALDPKIVELNKFAEVEYEILKDHNHDHLSLLKEQQREMETLQRQHQMDVQVLLADFDLQINAHKSYLVSSDNTEFQYFDGQLLQTQLGQMQTIQKKQIKSLQQAQLQELLAQQNLQLHETVQRLQNEGPNQQASLHNMVMAHHKHEHMLVEHQDQIMELLDEIQDQQQQSFDDSLSVLEKRKVNSIKEPPEQIQKRIQQQLRQLHGKHIEQLVELQNRELQNFCRLQKSIRKEIELHIKMEQRNLPKQVAHANLIHHQDAQIKRLAKLNDENKELINIIVAAIEKDLATTPGEPSGKVASSKTDDVLTSVNQTGVLQERIVKLQQQMVHQELPFTTLPKIAPHEFNLRKIQEVILQQQRRLQQQYRQELTLCAILEQLHELATVQRLQEQGLTNPYRENLIEVLNDCLIMAKKTQIICEKHCMRNSILRDIEEDINAFQTAYWKNRQKKDEPIDDLGKILLKGKIIKGNKKELHPLQKLLFENQSMQKTHVDHQLRLRDALKRTQARVVRAPIEQEIQLRRQQEKLILVMMKETEEIEEEQSEGLGPLDIQQNRINDLAAIQAWMVGIVNLESILVDKCHEKGYIDDITPEIEDLEPYFQQSHTLQEEHFKMVIVHQEELVSNHESIFKMLSPKQLALTEDQLKKQKGQLNQLKRDLQHFFKYFTDPFKSSKKKKDSNEEEEKIHDALDPELNELLEILQKQLFSLCTLLKDRQKQHKVKMQDMAKQVIRHQHRFFKLLENHRTLMAQYQDLHIGPEKQVLAELVTLHKRIAPCLKAQQEKLLHLMHQLRKNQENVHEGKEASAARDIDTVDTIVKSDKKFFKSRGSQISLVSLSGQRVTLTGVIAAESVSVSDKTEDNSLMKVFSSEKFKESMATGEKIKTVVAERRQSISKISLAVSESDVTEEQKEMRAKQKLITELKDQHEHLIQQVQIHNKPETFRRVQTLTYPRGAKTRKHDELQVMAAEYREKIKYPFDCSPNNPPEVANLEENRKCLFKLFEKSERFMLEKNELVQGASFLNMLKEINLKKTVNSRQSLDSKKLTVRSRDSIKKNQ